MGYPRFLQFVRYSVGSGGFVSAAPMLCNYNEIKTDKNHSHIMHKGIQEDLRNLWGSVRGDYRIHGDSGENGVHSRRRQPKSRYLAQLPIARGYLELLVVMVSKSSCRYLGVLVVRVPELGDLSPAANSL